MHLPLRTIFRALSHLPSILRARRVYDSQELSRINQAIPRLYLKLTRRNCYFQKSSYKKRADIFCHHYKQLNEYFDEEFLEQTIKGVVIWRNPNNPSFNIIFKISYELHFDGELDLVLRYDEAEVYTMSFAFIPSNIFNQNKEGILISRIQSKRENIIIYKNNKKDCFDVAPNHILFSCMRAICKYCGFDIIYGINGRSQAYLDRTYGVNFTINYDDFWVSLGGSEHNEEVHVITVPYKDKPLSQIIQKHRSRTKHKRDFKASLIKDIRKKLEDFNYKNFSAKKGVKIIY